MKIPAEPKVILRSCRDYDPERIRKIIREGLEELGLKPFGRTLVKPNLVAAGPLFPYAYTRPEFGEDVGGFPLGIMPGWEYLQAEVVLEPGDVALIYSDGVSDARNVGGELYGPRLHKRNAELSGTPSSVGKGLLQEIREFSLGRDVQADDITLICFGPLVK